ncbi:hypothetical protein E2P81_ATG07417 [Venturia nashicola]|uniref:DUF6841 domain-containing protein n=1 Tax=Venturia nashicola TaxID=86259 RepID=A0A4Z1P6I7_9PEZI|nr:hypothetical protein E6O75_ATG07570 [Venturia nashicola]TLD31927.1 hypothetical protein E2P81_ATG07417 [Venturia nashicola]
MPPPSPLSTQISTILNTYLSAFNTADYKTASKHYHSPAMAISASGVTILPSPCQMADLLSATVTKLKEDNFDHSEWVGEKKIIVLEDEGEKGLVMASCGCKRVRKDGSSCEEFTATYTLRKVRGEWLIVSIHQHPLNTQLN